MVQEEVIIEFSSNTQKVENNGDKLIEILNEIKDTLKDTSVDFKEFNKGLSETANKMNNVGNKGGKSTLKWATAFAAVTSAATVAFKKVSDWTAESAAFIGTQTRFNAVFDKTNGELQEATRWVKEYSESLALDSKEVMNATATFRMLTRNMGINNEESIKMSKNLTQVAYDLAAVRGEYDDVSIAMTAITSGLGGEAEAMKKYGVYLNQATLQATLYEAGINRTVSSLNAAERAQLIYYQIMKTTAGQQGYYAKTLLSPANALNIIRTQFTLLAREIGNVFIPILTAAVPIIMVLTKALRILAQALANIISFLFGIDFDFNDYSEGIGNIAGGIDGIGDSADGASKKMKNMLRDFDELHVVNFDEPSGSGSGMGAGGGGLNLPEIDYNAYPSALDAINEKLEKAEGLIKMIAIALAGLTIGGIAGKLMQLLGIMTKGQALAYALGAALSGIGLYITFDASQDILMNGLNAQNILQTVGGALTAGAGTALMFKMAGASGILSAKIGLIVTLGLIALNIGMGIGEWLKEKLGLSERFSYYIEVFDLNINEDSITESIGKVAAIIVNSFNDALLEKFNVSLPQIFGIVAFWLSIGLIGAVVAGFAGVPAIIGVAIATLAITIGILLGQLILKIGEKLTEIKENFSKKFEEIKTNVGNKIEETKENAIKKWEEIKTNLSNKIQEIKTNTSKKFEEIKTNIGNKIEETKTKVTDKFDEIKNGISDKMNWARDKVKEAIDKIKGLFNFEWKLPDIKMPHFRIDWDVSGIVGQAFQKLGFPGLPTLGVDWYMDGGFPTKGDLFIANEREPELIGSMGNRSVVANNTQITEGIADASYYGMRKALKEVDFGGDTAIYIGNRQITDYVVKQKKMDDKRYGR